MKIAAVQMVSTPRVDDNLDRARALIAQAAADGAELVALPEYFCLMGQRDSDKLAVAETDGEGPIQAMLADAAREHGVWLVGGTLPLRILELGDRVHNTTLVFGPEGQRVARYDKIHLFRFDDGERRYDEAATLQAGTEPTAFTVVDRSGHRWRVGLSICYDLRFAELYRRLADEGAEVLMIPSAFTLATGKDHWEPLIRARAIENQCWVIAPAQHGKHDDGGLAHTWGHAMIVDPWGIPAATASDGPGLAMAEIDLDRVRRVREAIPVARHRRLQVR